MKAPKPATAFDDLRDYRADGFALMSPDAAVAWIVALGVLVIVFWPYIK